MSQQFLLHLPDGTQYGPIDLATLETWQQEGRLPEDTLVWPEGAPAWVSLPQVLESTAALPVGTGAGPAPAPSPAPVAAPVAAPAPVPVPASAPAPKKLPSPARATAAPVPLATPADPKPKPKAAATARPARPLAPTAPAQLDDAQTLPNRIPVFDTNAPSAAVEVEAEDRPRGLSAGDRRRLMLAGVGIALVALLVAGMLAVMRPFLARRQAVAEVRRYALAERRVEDPGSGLVVELPAGWWALRGENPYVVRPAARLALTQPAKGVFGAISVVVRPGMIDDLDAHLAELLQQRLPRQPSQRESARGELQLGRGRGRLVRTTWEEELVPMQGATVAWADGYNIFSLEAWAPAALGDSFATELETLCKGLLPAGQLAARVDEAVERLAMDVPELSRDALRLLVAERMSQDRGLEDVPSSAMRAVSRGVDALGATEANEMRGIYQQIWAPVPEEQRVKLAGLLNEVKAGRAIPPSDGQALRDAIRAGVLALPEAERSRLQELSGRALRKSLLLP